MQEVSNEVNNWSAMAEKVMKQNKISHKKIGNFAPSWWRKLKSFKWLSSRKGVKINIDCKKTNRQIQFGWSLFRDSEEIIHSAEINDTSYERAACLHWDEPKNIFFVEKKIQYGRLKKTSISSSSNSQYFFMKISRIGP